MKKKHPFLEVAGWIGVALLLFNYALLALGFIGNDWRYHTLILLGSAGIATISYIKGAWQPMILNIFSAILATIALLK